MELDIEMINELEMDLSEFEALFNEIALYTFDYLKIEEDIEFSVSIRDSLSARLPPTRTL